MIAGKVYLSPRLKERLPQEGRKVPNEEEGGVFTVLTNREREILKLIAEGKSNTAIGKALHISGQTAKVHRANLMKKLGIHKSTDLVKYAIKAGVIES